MARGNDAAAAERELVTQYGDGNQTAEDLLAQHEEGQSAVRQAAQMKAVDAEATAAIDEPAPKHGGIVLNYAVRGGVLLVVEDVGGRLVKWHDEDPDGVDVTSAARSAALQSARGEGVPDAQPAQAKEPVTDVPPPAAPPETVVPHDPGDLGSTAAGGPGNPGDGSDTPASEQTGDNGDDESGEHAPKDVTVATIKAKLEDLKIDLGEATKKDDLWALLPEDAQTELVAASQS